PGRLRTSRTSGARTTPSPRTARRPHEAAGRVPPTGRAQAYLPSTRGRSFRIMARTGCRTRLSGRLPECEHLALLGRQPAPDAERLVAVERRAEALGSHRAPRADLLGLVLGQQLLLLGGSLLGEEQFGVDFGAGRVVPPFRISGLLVG